jgi:ABC-type transport system involved in multi-copper enzyme maturation permease subunit
VYTYYTPSVNAWHNLAILAGYFVAFFLLAWAALSFKRMTKR